jgi:uncharacterized protein YecE (DUF72 family)
MKIPEPLKSYLRIGTCSWKYDSWKGLYYDEGKRYRAFDYLGDYARHLDSVEIDQWFWSLFPAGVKLPDRETARRYAESVPDDFVFTVKAPNALTLTHFYTRQPKAYAEFANRPNALFLDVDLLHRFLEQLEPMHGKLGPVMFQFEYLNRKKMPHKEAFFEALHAFFDKAPSGFEYAVECRNPNYLFPAYFDVLKQHGVGHVYLEGYYMPPIGEVFDRHPAPTAGHAVIRLHGGDRLEIEGQTKEVWNRVVAPKPEGIASAVRMVGELSAKRTVIYLNVNNHFEGSAPLTIERFLERLGTRY